MRKLALFSEHIKLNAQIRIKDLLEKDIDEANLALIPTASNPYKKDRMWYDESKQELTDMGFKIEEVNLEEYANKKDALFDKLSTFDAICITGGNTFYLMYYVALTGFDRFLPALLDKGIVYIGQSAGSIIFNPDMSPVALADDPSLAPEVIPQGIRLLNFVVLPHWGSDDFKEIMPKIQEDYEAQGIKTIPIDDTQGVIIQDDLVEIID